jgi:hypothetical protein
MYKVKNELGPSVLDDIFERRINSGPKLRKTREFLQPLSKTVHYGENTLANLGCLTWEELLISIKSAESLNVFKNLVRKWQPKHCPCRLCKEYVEGVGFVSKCSCKSCADI